MFTNLCQDIKLASNYAFNFDLTTDDLFNCHRMEDSYKQIENTLEIIYYVYMDTVDYELRGLVLRAKPTKSLKPAILGISDGLFISNYAEDLSQDMPKLQP